MRIDNPPAHQLLSGEGPPPVSSGLEPPNGVNDPWRWWPGNGWVSQAFDVSWGAGAAIPSFASPTAGALSIIVGTGDATSVPAAVSSAQVFYTATVVGDAASDPAPLRQPAPATSAATGAGSGVAFLLWDFFGEVQVAEVDPDNDPTDYTNTNADVLPPETRTVADILGSDFTIVDGPRDWVDAGVGTEGDLYIDTLTGNLYGPKTSGGWGGAIAGGGNIVISPDGTIYRIVVSNAGVLSTEPA